MRALPSRSRFSKRNPCEKENCAFLLLITFAQQILKTESLRLQEQFADAVRGLLVFGDKVVQPKALVCLKATQEAGD